MDYTNTSVLVTGAASGIGKALAIALGLRGARVICADRDVEGAESTAETIGNDAVAIACNLADPNAAEELVKDAYQLSNRLDLVCSNAGIGHRGSPIDVDMNDPQALTRLFEVNFFAALKIAQTYQRLLVDNGHEGRLMTTASENSLSVPEVVKGEQMVFYGATKHALLAALEWMRVDESNGPIKYHALLPGAVYTPLVQRSLPDPAMAPKELELISPEQCADIALRGIDAELFYIPTQAHLLEDMQPRVSGISQALDVLGIELTY